MILGNPFWDEELTILDDPFISIDNINSELELSVGSLGVNCAGSVPDLGLEVGGLTEPHQTNPNMILDDYVESIDSKESTNPSGLSKFLRWFILILQFWFYTFCFTIIRKFKDILELVKLIKSYFSWAWKWVPKVGLVDCVRFYRVLNSLEITLFRTCLQAFRLFEKWRCDLEWFSWSRVNPKPFIIIKNVIFVIVTHTCKLGMLDSGWFCNEWVQNPFQNLLVWYKMIHRKGFVNGFESLVYPFGKLLFLIRLLHRKEIKFRRDMLWKTILRILLLILLGYILFDSRSLRKIEEIWFGYDHGFGLINTWLGDSSWATSYGVCAFGTDWTSLVGPRSKGNTVGKWVRSRLLNTNHDFVVVTILDCLADFRMGYYRSVDNSAVIENEAVRTFGTIKTRWRDGCKTEYPSIVLFTFCIWVVNGSKRREGCKKKGLSLKRGKIKGILLLSDRTYHAMVTMGTIGRELVNCEGLSVWNGGGRWLKGKTTRGMELGIILRNTIYTFLLDRWYSSELRSIPPKEGGDDADMERALFVIDNKEVFDSGLVSKKADCDGKKTWRVSIPYRVASLSEWRVRFYNGPRLNYAWELGSNEDSSTLELWQLNCDAVHMTATQREMSFSSVKFLTRYCDAASYKTATQCLPDQQNLFRNFSFSRTFTL